MNEEVREVFGRCELWAPSSAEVVDALLNASKLVRFEAGEMVLDKTSSGRFVVVLDGRVRLSHSGGGGHEFSFSSALPSEIIALVQAIRGLPLGSDFVAAEESVVALVPITALHEAIEVDPDIAYRMAITFADRFDALLRLTALMDSEVHVRLADYILELSSSMGGKDTDIDLGMSRRELASRLGTVPETLSRAFGRLKDDGLICTNGRRFASILDRPGLEALLP
jgi:CRP/FNR family transcriptional regulator, dissimilatory nitrate respiration regulator